MHIDKRHGFALIETMVVGAFLAVSTLGLTAAMISGTTLENKAHQTMASVATAENLMAKIRAEAQSGFNTLSATYHDSTTAAQTSIGFSEDEMRQLKVSMPLAESEIAGAIDLNGNGMVDSGSNEDARLLVLEVSGQNKLRLRSVVYNLQRLPGILLERTAGENDKRAVVYGETRDVKLTEVPPDYTTEPVVEPVVEEEAPTEEPTSEPVSVAAATFVGKGAEVVLANNTSEKLTPTSITLVPDKDTLYAGDISLNGDLLYCPCDSQTPGALTIKLDTKVSLAPGEATLSIGDFTELDKKGAFKLKSPKTLTVMVTFDDGSVATTVITK